MMNVLITGTSRGIGFELSRHFAQQKDVNVFALSRSVAGLEKLKAACLKDGGEGEVITLPADLGKNEDITSVINSITAQTGTLDILINNAGYLFKHSFVDFPEKEMKNIFEVNFFAVVRLVQKALPLLSKSSLPHIVNISSMGGYQESSKFSGLSMYSSSKGALSILTECLAEELKEKNISVNCLALGAVQTEMVEEAFPGYKAPVSATEMAAFIMDFALKGRKYFNGKILPVNLSTP